MIAGPTGTGKSELAVRLAETIGGEVVNYDSVQIYRGFDIGSAKPSAELRARVPHHLFDIVDADADFNAASYARLAGETCSAILARRRAPLFVGGTGFYLRAFLGALPEIPARDEAIRARLRRIASRPCGPSHLHRWLSRIDPVSAARIAPADRHRVERALEVWMISGRPISNWPSPSADAPDARPAIKIALSLDRAQSVGILDQRVEEMYRAGLIEETRTLLTRFSRTSRPFTTIGYREALAVVEGTMALRDAVAETQRRTRAYAKRQMTWLRGERNLVWIDASDPEHTFSAALQHIEQHLRRPGEL
ncbi:MAG TPA: tRNA (adenosine(37)-N6)-dimethylallyltransferase MiaA [Thermoanaerobaculia bacterium]|nr:tRNA (adenosine(37)-N6)-dimethylallyltransferase MiaA [Thermoanaerobaculia bacterium]